MAGTDINRGDISDLAKYIARIARSVAAMVPENKPMFASPATLAAFAGTEAALGVSLPDDIRALYQLADGQTETGPSLLNAFALMPLAEVVDAAAFLNDFFPDGRNEENPDHDAIEADPGIRPVWWSSDWIPVMANGGGDYYCLDLKPADDGTVGQIIAYFHDETFRLHVACSMTALLHMVAVGLEDGSYTILDGMITEVEDN